MKLDELKSITKKIEKQKNIITDARDELYDLGVKIDDLLESFNEGISNLEEGIFCIKEGINSISEVV